MLALSVHYSGSGEEGDGEMMERGGLDEGARVTERKKGGKEVESMKEKVRMSRMEVERNICPASPPKMACFCQGDIALYWPL